MADVLNIKNLKVIFRTGETFVRAVEGVNINIREGERVAIVGESGCGKSVTSLACMRLLTTPPAYISADEFTFVSSDGTVHNLLEKSEVELAFVCVVIEKDAGSS